MIYTKQKSIGYTQSRNMTQVVIPSPKMVTCSVTMATLKPHKSWQSFISKTFIPEKNGGLSWLFHCYCWYASPATPKVCVCMAVSG